MRDEVVRIVFGAAETADPWFYLEIVLRTLVMYLYTIFLARMVGQGGIGQIGPFEFVLVIAVGSAAGDPMFYPEVGLAQGILVITIVIVAHRATGFVFTRHRRLEEKVEGLPVQMVDGGEIVREALGSGTLTERELMAMLRVEGVRDVGEIERAYLETSGKLSVFRYREEAARRTRSTLPVRTE
jgi:uncharacterized membrane protein YcaP (DUF421 family)